jgi:hypothetical protein
MENQHFNTAQARLIDLYENSNNMAPEVRRTNIRDINESINRMIFQGRQPAIPTRRWWMYQDDDEPEVVEELEEEFEEELEEEFEEEREDREERFQRYIRSQFQRYTRRVTRRLAEKNHYKAFVTALTDVEIEAICEDCAICFDKPTKLNSITTECGHEFCKGCYKVWVNAANSNKSCPTCRNPNPKIIAYRPRYQPSSVISNL